MDKLTELIRSLSKQEARNFKIFEKRIGADTFEKKMLKLYDYLRNNKYDEYDSLLVKKLYPPDNRNAYYRLKNRLITNLQKSLLEFHLGVDKRMTALGTIMLSRIFFYKAHYQLSYHYLQSAEKQALESKSFNLLNLIYDEIIHLSKYYYEIDPQYYISLKAKRNEEYAQIQRADYLLANINYQLHKTNFSERGGSVLEALEKLQQEFDLLPDDLSESLQIEINMTVRNILLQKKEFTSLEAYLLESYERFVAQGFFTKSNHREKIILLTWIVNTMNKNAHFKESGKWLDELERSLLDYNKQYYGKYIWTYYMGRVTNYSSSNQNDKAIELLEGLKQQEQDESIRFYRPFIFMSLVSLYFNIGDYHQATVNLNALIHTNQYNSLPPAIRLGLSISEVIIRVEMDDWMYAHGRVQALKRSHRNLLNKEEYQFEKGLAALLGAIVNEPDAFRQQKLKGKIQKFLDDAQMELGSNYAVDPVAWLTARLNNRSYYDVILSMNRVEK